MVDLNRSIHIDHVWLSLICVGVALFFSLLLQPNTGPVIAVCLVMAGWCNYRGIIRPGRTRVDLVANLFVLSLVIVQLVALVTWHVMRW